MIAGAEAHRIARALDSVKAWAGEIIVVLNEEVQDGTDRIAEACGARVVREPWKGHIEQKNSATAKATQDWVLGLDADEEVSPALRDEIMALLRRPPTEETPAAYSFPRCTFYCGRWIRHGDWYPDRKVRLWRRGRARWGGVNPHDKLLIDGTVGRLHHDLHHYSMDSIDHHVRKAITYSGLFVQERLSRGRRVNWAELGCRPLWRFVRGYVLRLGFLDGWAGWVVARMVAFETFLRYAKLREAQQAARTAKNSAQDS
jgi:glycosyltransferase involved in cell wall biosynthesis